MTRRVLSEKISELYKYSEPLDVPDRLWLKIHYELKGVRGMKEIADYVTEKILCPLLKNFTSDIKVSSYYNERNKSSDYICMFSDGIDTYGFDISRLNIQALYNCCNNLFNEYDLTNEIHDRQKKEMIIFLLSQCVLSIWNTKGLVETDEVN